MVAVVLKVRYFDCVLFDCRRRVLRVIAMLLALGTGNQFLFCCRAHGLYLQFLVLRHVVSDAEFGKDAFYSGDTTKNLV